eukprot:Hpha_TRINITY_DN15903_c2_g1::TRINITY_DN15903_c2_g1_i1::g.73536::m.73536
MAAFFASSAARRSISLSRSSASASLRAVSPARAAKRLAFSSSRCLRMLLCRSASSLSFSNNSRASLSSASTAAATSAASAAVPRGLSGNGAGGGGQEEEVVEEDVRLSDFSDDEDRAIVEEFPETLASLREEWAQEREAELRVAAEQAVVRAAHVEREFFVRVERPQLYLDRLRREADAARFVPPPEDPMAPLPPPPSPP